MKIYGNPIYTNQIINHYESLNETRKQHERNKRLTTQDKVLEYRENNSTCCASTSSTSSSTEPITPIETLIVDFTSTYAPCSIVPLTVSFTNTTTYDGSGSLTYFWDFGDSNTSTEENPTNVYTASNSFNVTLQVTSSIGSYSSEDKLNYISTTTGSVPPPITSNLMFWYPAGDCSQFSDSTGLTASVDGGAVRLWKDRSGFGRDVVTETVNPAIFYTNRLAGYPAAYFSNVNNDNRLASTTMSLNLTAFTAFAVVKIANNGSPHQRIVAAVNANGNHLFGSHSDGLGRGMIQVNQRTHSANLMTSYSSWVFIRSDTTGLIKVGAAGETPVSVTNTGNTNTLGNNTNYRIMIGGPFASGFNGFVGDVVEYFGYDTELTQPQIDEVFAYLNNKFGV